MLCCSAAQRDAHPDTLERCTAFASHCVSLASLMQEMKHISQCSRSLQKCSIFLSRERRISARERCARLCRDACEASTDLETRENRCIQNLRDMLHPAERSAAWRDLLHLCCISGEICCISQEMQQISPEMQQRCSRDFAKPCCTAETL
jgi:hypothetical protein